MTTASEIKRVLRIRSRRESKTVVYLRGKSIAYEDASRVNSIAPVKARPWVGIYDTDTPVEQIGADLRRIAA